MLHGLGARADDLVPVPEAVALESPPEALLDRIAPPQHGVCVAQPPQVQGRVDREMPVHGVFRSRVAEQVYHLAAPGKLLHLLDSPLRRVHHAHLVAIVTGDVHGARRYSQDVLARMQLVLGRAEGRRFPHVRPQRLALQGRVVVGQLHVTEATRRCLPPQELFHSDDGALVREPLQVEEIREAQLRARLHALRLLRLVHRTVQQVEGFRRRQHQRAARAERHPHGQARRSGSGAADGLARSPPSSVRYPLARLSSTARRIHTDGRNGSWPRRAEASTPARRAAPRIPASSVGIFCRCSEDPRRPEPDARADAEPDCADALER
eukprot:scaffold1253_cov245-Pinguiococcus_pyrenoidosus.AAC.13